MPVGNPLAFFSGIIQIQHRRDGIHSQPVGMVLLQPEEGAADQKAADFVTTVVEHRRPPIGMEALAGVRMFEEVAAVESTEPVFIGRKMGRHPIQNDSDIVLVELVDQVHEVLRRPIVAGGGKVPGGLIAPGAKEGMVHQGQKLHMSEAQSLHILN